MHEVLVQNILVCLGEWLLWIGYDDYFVVVQHACLGTQHTAVYLVVVRQGLAEVIYLSFGQLAMSLQEGYLLHLVACERVYSFHEGKLQVLNAMVEVLLAAQSAVIA